MEKRTLVGAILALVLLSGCAALSGVGALSSIVAPGVSALIPDKGISAHIGKNETKVEDATIGKREQSKVESKVSGIKAKKDVKLDQSSQKKDQKTEIGEVKGDVKVVQGPTTVTLVLLALGWPLFVLFLVYSLWRKRQE